MNSIVKGFFTINRVRSLLQPIGARHLVSQPSSINQSEYAGRRSRFAEQLGYTVDQQLNTNSKHVVLLPGAEVQYMAFHVPYPFHQDSNFSYFTGLQEPNAILAMCIDVEPRSVRGDINVTCTEHMFVEVRSAQAEIWDGPVLGIADAVKFTGINLVHNLEEFGSFLESNGPSTYLWYSPLVQSMTEKQTPNQLVLSQVINCRRRFGKHASEIKNPAPLIDKLRFVKSPSEIRLLQYAATMTADCVKQLMHISYPGINESTLSDQIQLEAHRRACSLGYPPVVAGGERANTIHYLNNNKVIQDGDLVLVDAGCRYEGYTADISRTWPVNGHYNSKQRILHEILEETQKTCAHHAIPGTSLHHLYRLMLTELARHLVAERILMCSQEELNTVIQQICPHAVGHYLGLDVHDTPTISQSQPLQPGVVFPLEPGIYLRPSLQGLGIRPEFMGLALRLEDDFVMGNDGVANRLTDEIPTTVEQIEAVVQQRTEKPSLTQSSTT